MNEDMESFVQKLDELLQKYNELLSINHDQECLRLLQIQRTESKEKIAALEAKLRAAKTRLKFEITARKKAETEREKLSQILETVKSCKSSLSSSVPTSGFITPNTHLTLSEDDFNDFPNELKKHQPNNACVSVSKMDTTMATKSRKKYPTVSRVTSDLSYLGVAKLDKSYITKMNSTSFVAHEPLFITFTAPDTPDGVKLNKTFKLRNAKNSQCTSSVLKQETTPVTRRFVDSNTSIAKNLEDFMSELLILKLLLDDLNVSLKSSEEIKIIVCKTITAIDQLLASNLKIAAKSATQLINTAESSSRGSSQKIESTKEKADNETVNKSTSKNGALMQTILQRFFATRKNTNFPTNANDQKMSAGSRHPIAIKSEAESALQLTPITNLRNLTKNEKTPMQFIFRENINRIVYSPIIYEALNQQATNDQSEIFKKCLHYKMNAINTQQAICQEAPKNKFSTEKAIQNIEAVGMLSQVKAEPQYLQNADTMFENIGMGRRKHDLPPLPAERPPWHWDKNVPSAKAEFIFWDNINQMPVYCCRSCFKKFPNGIQRYNHEKTIELVTKEAHFGYYTSDYYLKQKAKSRHRR